MGVSLSGCTMLRLEEEPVRVAWSGVWVTSSNPILDQETSMGLAFLGGRGAVCQVAQTSVCGSSEGPPT